tara:strand:- start:546 stop:806 length:261 start_codon:yes stop_codon:yes gene_type:complete
MKTQYYGQLFLEALNALKSSERKTLIFAANKRPSTGRPAQVVVLMHKNEDGSLLFSPYYNRDLLHLDPHPINCSSWRLINFFLTFF